MTDVPVRHTVMSILSCAKEDPLAKDIHDRVTDRGYKGTLQNLRCILFHLLDDGCVVGYPAFDRKKRTGKAPHAYYLSTMGRRELDYRNIGKNIRWLRSHQTAWRRL